MSAARFDRAFETAPHLEVSPDGKYASGQNPFTMDGIHYFPANSMSCGPIIKPGGDMLVQLVLLCTSPIGNSLGSFLRMTPEGARELAGFLVEQAVQVEANVAAQAAAAIEAARKGGSNAAQ